MSNSIGNEMYTLRINGQDRPVKDAWVGESLLYVLRERLELPGAKGACEQGECGSCTVLMDGDAVCSCLVMAATAVGADIVTVEGLIEKDPSMASTARQLQTNFRTDNRRATSIHRRRWRAMRILHTWPHRCSASFARQKS